MVVSIVIPFHNSQEFIADAINSAFAQTYKEIEVICVDNNSEDNSLSIAKKLKETTYPKLIITEESQKGAPSARNRGLDLASGEYIQFLDSDDILLPTKIEHQVHLIQQSQELISLVAGSCIQIKIDGTREDYTSGQYRDNCWTSLVTTSLSNTSSNLFNTSLVRSVGGWDASRKSSQEYYLMFELLKVNEHIIYDPELLNINRARVGSLSRIDPSLSYLRHLIFKDEVFKYAFDLKLNNEIEFRHLFFLNTRRIHRFDPQEARKTFRKYFTNYTPLKKDINSSLYIFMSGIIGFSLSDYFYKMINK